MVILSRVYAEHVMLSTFLPGPPSIRSQGKWHRP